MQQFESYQLSHLQLGLLIHPHAPQKTLLSAGVGRCAPTHADVHFPATTIAHRQEHSEVQEDWHVSKYILCPVKNKQENRLFKTFPLADIPGLQFKPLWTSENSKTQYIWLCFQECRKRGSSGQTKSGSEQSRVEKEAIWICLKTSISF